MDSISAQEANNRLVELIKQVAQEKKQIRITSDGGNVIVLSEETYGNILVTLELLSTPGLMDNVNFCEGFDLEEEEEPMLRVSSH